MKVRVIIEDNEHGEELTFFNVTEFTTHSQTLHNPAKRDPEHLGPDIRFLPPKVNRLEVAFHLSAVPQADGKIFEKELRDKT